MILKVPDDCPCEVFDANGAPLEDVIWCNTETGEAIHVARPYQVAPGAELKTEVRFHPAPLTYKKGEPLSKSQRAERHLVDEIDRVIDRFRHEYCMTYAQVLGCLELIKIDLMTESYEEE